MSAFFRLFSSSKRQNWESNDPPELLASSKRFRRRKLKKQLEQQRQLPRAPEGVSVIHISVPCDERKSDVVTQSEHLIDVEEEMRWLESMRDLDLLSNSCTRDSSTDSEEPHSKEDSSEDENTFKKMFKTFRKAPNNNKTRDKRSGSGSSCTSYSSGRSHRDSYESSLTDYSFESRPNSDVEQQLEAEHYQTLKRISSIPPMQCLLLSGDDVTSVPSIEELDGALELSHHLRCEYTSEMAQEDEVHELPSTTEIRIRRN